FEMKVRFTYLYIAFIVSLLVLVTLSLLFYRRMHAHITYTGEMERSFAVLFQLKSLQERVALMEAYHRASILTEDSALLDNLSGQRVPVDADLERLDQLLAGDAQQHSRFQLRRTTI